MNGILLQINFREIMISAKAPPPFLGILTIHSENSDIPKK